MKSNFIKKFLVGLIIISIFMNVIFINYAQATSSKEYTNYEVDEEIEADELAGQKLDEILETEEKIMMYDARTNETTEVDMEQLRQEVSKKKSSRISKDGMSFDSYTPPAIASKNMIYREKEKSIRKAEDPPVELDLVENTSYQPYVNVCRIYNKEMTAGTAALVGPNLALTAAHCVFNDKNNNEIFINWNIYPGYNKVDMGYAPRCGWDRVFYSDKWMQTHERDYDWAICVLQDDVGNKLGYFGGQMYGTDAELKNMEIRIYGYPGESKYGFQFNAPYQYTAWGQITKIPLLFHTNDLFEYYSLTYEGMSGGPIVKLDRTTHIIGIIVGVSETNPKKGYGVRMTQTMIDIIINNS